MQNKLIKQKKQKAQLIYPQHYSNSPNENSISNHSLVDSSSLNIKNLCERSIAFLDRNNQYKNSLNELHNRKNRGFDNQNDTKSELSSKSQRSTDKCAFGIKNQSVVHQNLKEMKINLMQEIKKLKKENLEMQNKEQLVKE